MSKKYTIPALIVAVMFLLSFFLNPPNGYTGGPNQSLCTSCHSLNGALQMGNISVSGLPAMITPNTAYTLTMTSSNPDGIAELAGFQMIILNSNNQQAGTISSPSTGSTVQTEGGLQYWEHNPAQMYPMSNVVMWTATWVAPAGPANTTISYYAAGNIANGNGQPTGDRIVQTTGSGMLMGGGVVLTVTISNVNHILCAGQSTGSATAMATGGIMPYVFNWSNGTNGPTISNVPAGSYTVTVTDNSGTTATASMNITQPPPLELNTPSITHVSCNGGNNGSINVSAVGGVVPYFYSWSNGSNGPTISNLSAGPYTVTVTDDNNCSATATYTVNQPGPIVINLIDLNHESCAGADDGSIFISVSGGVNPVFAEWSNGSIGFSISNLEPGMYAVTVTDNNNCTKNASYTINAGGTVNVNLVQQQNVTCFGGNNGSITVNATGGLPPYTYLWSNGASGPTASGLTAGNYLVTVSDFSDCTVVNGYMVTQPSQVTVNMTTTDETSPGANNGTATATAGGGTPGYSYLWSNGGMTSMISGLAPGTYIMTVTDMNGCSSTATGTVNAFGCSLDVNLGPDIIICEDDTVQIIANVTGGTGVLIYSWNTGGASQSITITNEGTFCVTVTDQSNCTDTDCINVAIDSIPSFSCPVVHESVPGANDGSIDCSALPDVVSYHWSNGEVTPGVINLSPGAYCVTITNTIGCTGEQCFTIQPAGCLMVVTATQSDVTCAGELTGSISLSVNGATPPVTIMWSNGSSLPTVSNLPAGSYSVTVSDALSCMDILNFNITEPPPIIISVDSIHHIGETPGNIHVSVSGGTPPYMYQWTFPTGGSTNVEDPGNLTVSGNYTLAVTDAVNCTVIRDSIFVDMDVSTGKDPLLPTLLVYPVPAGDYLQLVLEKEIIEALILAADGRLLKRINSPFMNRIPVGEMESGWYVVRVFDGSYWHIARFVK